MLPWSQLIGLHQHTYVGHNNAARWTVLANFIPLLGNLLNRLSTITAIKKTITAVAKKKKRSNNVAMFPRFCWTIKIVCVRMELNPWRDLTPLPPLHSATARKHGQSFPHPLDTLTFDTVTPLIPQFEPYNTFCTPFFPNHTRLFLLFLSSPHPWFYILVLFNCPFAIVLIFKSLLVTNIA